MKKLTALLLALALVLAMTACVREGPVETQPTQPPLPDDGNAANQFYTEPPQEDQVPNVYYLNNDPATDAAWQALADEYTGATGTEVIVLTAVASTYDDTLRWELGRDAAVTLFHAQGPHSLQGLEEHCFDLTGSELLKKLTHPELALTLEGATVGLPMEAEGLGLLVNTALLEQAGFTLDDLATAEGLRAVTEDVTKRSDALGFRAFAVPVLDTSDRGAAEILAALAVGIEAKNGGNVAAGLLGDRLDEIREVFTLAAGSFGGDPAELMNMGWTAMTDSFAAGEALFCLGTSRTAQGLGKDLALVPIPGTQSRFACAGTGSYWIVSGSVSEVDRQATLDFLTWCLTEKATALEAMGFRLPYGRMDPLTEQLLSFGAETVPLYWWAAGDPGLLAELCASLTVYAVTPNDSNWELVREAFRK